MSQGDSVPGCYLRLRPRKRESFLGYLMNLAASNSYTGISDLLKAVVTSPAPGDLFRWMVQVRTRREDLSWLGKAGASDAEALSEYSWDMLPDGAVFYEGCRIEPDALLSRTAQVCPHCLRELGMALDEWDLAPVVACPQHKVMLVDTCTCGSPISWKRHELHYCSCGNDLRGLPTMSASRELIYPSEHFGALAPFRVILAGGKTETIRWDSMFLIAKSAALTVPAWTTSAWPEGAYFRELPLKQRAAAISVLGSCYSQGAYDLGQVGRRLRAVLEPLNAMPLPDVAGDHAFELLFSKAALPREVAAALADYQPAEPLSGAERFGGRPPVLKNRAEVVQFLRTDEETLSALLAKKVLYQPTGAELGFDVYAVLNAQRFLQSALLDLEQLTMLVGLPTNAEDLRRSLVLRPWNPKSAVDSRVELAHVKLLHLRLMELAAMLPAPQHPSRLEDAANASERPFAYLLDVIGRVIDGQVSSLCWEPPYRWGDLCLKTSALAAWQ